MKILIPILFVIFLVSSIPSHLTYEKSTVSFKRNKMTVYFAQTPEEQALGLSKVKRWAFGVNEAMFFIGNKYENKNFWMPETFFDLDIFFLDENMKVIDIDRNVPHFEYRVPDFKVPRAKSVFAYHVMEMKSESSISKEINEGDVLNITLPKRDKETHR